MKKLLSILTVATLVATFPAASFAKKAAAASPAPGATPAADSSTAAKTIPLYSEVSTINAADKSWTHKNKDGKEVTFKVTAATEIKQSGAPAKFEDIKVGDWVSGSRKKTGDNQWEVVKITKFGAKTGEKSEKPSATPAAATPAAKSKKGT